MKRQRFPRPRSNRQSGFSMVEMLVAIVVFSIGLIGVAIMQLKGMSYTKDAGSRTQATILARAMTDRMRATMQEAYRAPVVGNVDFMEQLDYRYPGTPSCTVGCVAALQTIAQADQSWLTQQLVARLPPPNSGVRYTIARPSTGNPRNVTQMHTLTVRWGEGPDDQQLAIDILPF